MVTTMRLSVPCAIKANGMQKTRALSTHAKQVRIYPFNSSHEITQSIGALSLDSATRKNRVGCVCSDNYSQSL